MPPTWNDGTHMRPTAGGRSAVERRAGRPPPGPPTASWLIGTGLGSPVVPLVNRTRASAPLPPGARGRRRCRVRAAARSDRPRPSDRGPRPGRRGRAVGRPRRPGAHPDELDQLAQLAAVSSGFICAVAAPSRAAARVTAVERTPPQSASATRPRARPGAGQRGRPAPDLAVELPVGADRAVVEDQRGAGRDRPRRRRRTARCWSPWRDGSWHRRILRRRSRGVKAGAAARRQPVRPRRYAPAMQDHSYSIVVDGTPEEVWAIFWSQRSGTRTHGDVTIEILHPGDADGEGLVRHCTSRSRNGCCRAAGACRGSGSPRSGRTSRGATTRSASRCGPRPTGWTRLEDLGDGPDPDPFRETYHAFNPVLRALFEAPVHRAISRSNDETLTASINAGIAQLAQPPAPDRPRADRNRRPTWRRRPHHGEGPHARPGDPGRHGRRRDRGGARTADVAVDDGQHHRGRATSAAPRRRRGRSTPTG